MLQDQPGCISTALHQAISPRARFELISIARWKSPGAFQRAMAVLLASGAYPAIEGLGINPALHTVVREDNRAP